MGTRVLITYMCEDNRGKISRGYAIEYSITSWIIKTSGYEGELYYLLNSEVISTDEERLIRSNLKFL